MTALNNFPFPGLPEFRFAERRGLAELGIDPHSALHWALGEAPFKIRLETGALRLLTVLVVVGFAWYGALYELWLLLWLPVFALTFWIAGPFTTQLGRRISTPYILTMVAIFALRYFLGARPILDLLTLGSVAQLVAAATFSEMYGIAFRHFKDKVLRDEPSFERFWKSGAIQVVRADGKGYSSSEVVDVDREAFPPWRQVARVKRSRSTSAT